MVLAHKLKAMSGGKRLHSCPSPSRFGILHAWAFPPSREGASSNASIQWKGCTHWRWITDPNPKQNPGAWCSTEARSARIPNMTCTDGCLVVRVMDKKSENFTFQLSPPLFTVAQFTGDKTWKQPNRKMNKQRNSTQP